MNFRHGGVHSEISRGMENPGGRRKGYVGVGVMLWFSNPSCTLTLKPGTQEYWGVLGVWPIWEVERQVSFPHKDLMVTWRLHMTCELPKKYVHVHDFLYSKPSVNKNVLCNRWKERLLELVWHQSSRSKPSNPQLKSYLLKSCPAKRESIDFKDSS